MSREIIAVVGPTASGKSELAVEIAKKFGGEIISADSRQVYLGLDIGTGKITKKEMRGVSHHLLDIRDPRKQYSAAEFTRDAKKKIEEIARRKKIPIIVGGTGFWIDSLLLGLRLPDVPPDPRLRLRLSRKSASELFHALMRLDPARARAIDRDNPHRLVRAIEIARSLGRVPKLERTPKYRTLWIGIKKEKQELKTLIRKRLLRRVRSGLFAEGSGLRKSGLSWKRFYELGLEYRSIADFLRKKSDKKAILLALERANNRYAKRQTTWFKKNPDIRWIRTKDEAFRLVRKSFPGKITQPLSRSTQTGRNRA